MRHVLFLLCICLSAFTSFPQIEIEKIDKIIELSIPVDGPGGTLLLFRNGNIIHKRSFGFAELEKKVSNKAETVYQIGSVSKMFTAAGILLLIEEGKLSLADTLTKFFPDFIQPAGKVTIENLLLHNSGIKSFTSIPQWNPGWDSKRSLKEVIDLVKNLEFDYEVGEKFSYNNSGYVILASIIEKISGMEYGEFLKKRIFNPLNMNSTRHGADDENIGFRAKGYSFDLKEKKNIGAVFTEFHQLAGAGSLISTAEDLLKWDDAMRNKKLLSSASWENATSQIIRTNFGENVFYGFGWINLDYKGHKLIWHNGGMPGFRAAYYNFLDDSTTIIFLSNSDIINSDAIVRQIAAYLFNLDTEKREAVELSEEDLKKYEGTYTFNLGNAVIKLIDGKLTSAIPDYPFLPNILIPTSDSTFYVDGRYDSFVSFSPEPDGSINKGQFDESGLALSFYREGFKPKFDKVELTEAQLKVYEGIYEFAPGAEIKIYLKEKKLRALIQGQPEYTLNPAGNNIFLLEGLDGFKFIFEMTEDNKPAALTSSQPNGEFKAKKKIAN